MKTSHMIVVAAVVLAVTATAFRIITRRDEVEPAQAAPPQRVASAPEVETLDASAPRLVTLEVGGMVCAACVDKVQKQLAQVPGVSRVEVSLADQKARIQCAGSVADSSLTAAVRRAGPEYLGFVVER